jgi:hypothetical protein
VKIEAGILGEARRGSTRRRAKTLRQHDAPRGLTSGARAQAGPRADCQAGGAPRGGGAPPTCGCKQLLLLWLGGWWVVCSAGMGLDQISCVHVRWCANWTHYDHTEAFGAVRAVQGEPGAVGAAQQGMPA